jgi:hypothetical protein
VQLCPTLLTGGDGLGEALIQIDLWLPAEEVFGAGDVEGFAQRKIAFFSVENGNSVVSCVTNRTSSWFG